VIFLICAYCGADVKSTREHIFPSSIIKLFPECKLAYDFDRDIVHRGEATINDVCKDCNGSYLSELDSYGKSIVEQYFVREYSPADTLKFNYDYDTIVRWLAKMAFNSCRAAKGDNSFFEENIEYIKGNDKYPKQQISLFGGLWVDVALTLGDVLGSVKLQINRSAHLLTQGVINPGTWKLDMTLADNQIQPPKLHSKYFFRLGSGLFLLLMWEKLATEEDVRQSEKVIDTLFPYSLINPDKKDVILRKCTDPFNTMQPYVIHSDAGISISEQYAYGMLMPNGTSSL
jgi:hypothetical protein